MDKKDLLITALLASCFTAALFTILPTRSQSYDPWVDLDGDGQISIYDVVQMTSIYGESGDPTKNVNVTNWPSGWLQLPQEDNRTERIEVFSINSEIEGSQYRGGVLLSDPADNLFAFGFNPICRNYNVTSVYVSMTVYKWKVLGTNTRYWVTLNGQTMYQETTKAVAEDVLYVFSILLEPTLIYSIRQGTNTLGVRMQALDAEARVFRAVETYQIVVFIEYEYAL